MGDELKLFDAAKIEISNTLEFELGSPNATLGLTWDTSRLSEGILVVAPAADGVMSIHARELDNAEIYTLSGQRLTKRPRQSGVYVVNGRQILLK